MKVSAKNGRFVLFFDWMGIECEQDSGLSASPENLQPALDLLKAVKEQIDSGNFNFSDFTSERKEISPPLASCIFQSTDKPTFSQFSEQWFREHQLEWRPAYRAIVNVRRRNIWRKESGVITESGPRLGLAFRRRACGVASADVRWSVS